MSLEPITYQPVGIVRSPFHQPTGAPIQSVAAYGVHGTVELEPDFVSGEGFSHLWLLCHLHRVTGFDLEVVPFLDTVSHGIFATRSPVRPNPISLTAVRLERIEGSVLHISELDLVDGTPVLDIKPYVPRFDLRQTERIGWFADRLTALDATLADDRFQRPSERPGPRHLESDR